KYSRPACARRTISYSPFSTMLTITASTMSFPHHGGADARPRRGCVSLTPSPTRPSQTLVDSRLLGGSDNASHVLLHVILLGAPAETAFCADAMALAALPECHLRYFGDHGRPPAGHAPRSVPDAGLRCLLCLAPNS